jgi:hypothetical protein
MERIDANITEHLSLPALKTPESARQRCEFHIRWDLSRWFVEPFPRSEYLKTFGDEIAIVDDCIHQQALS